MSERLLIAFRNAAARGVGYRVAYRMPRRYGLSRYATDKSQPPGAAADGRPPAVPARCSHCGLPSSGPPDASGRLFCCTGCKVVYHALQSAGLDDGYYALRDVGHVREAVPPARTEVDALLADEVDSDWFIEERAHPGPDGTLQAELSVDGVHCAACLWLIEQMPFQIDGVRAARLNLPRGRLSISWDPGTTRLSETVRWLARFGYRAHPTATSVTPSATSARERSLLLKLGVAWALAGNVMLIAFALYAGLDAAGGPLAAAARWLSLALAVPAVLYGGSEFYTRALRSIGLAWHRRSLRPLHMDVPITLGVAVGFAHSAWATSRGLDAVWFDSITVLIAALLTARWLQERSHRMAGDAADHLLSLIPSMARRVASGGRIEIVRTQALAEGDVVEVPPEEVVPADGVVLSGTSSINNAVLTGESRPLTVATGAGVHAGAMNLTGSIRIQVRAAGEASRVGRLLAWMRDPDAGRAPVVMMADRMGGYFVGAVIALSLITAGVWLLLDPSQAALNVAALLVITCPCALGMATPLAMTIAVGRAARAGIFVKHESALQELTQIDCFILDKTGTLTEGRPTLVEWFGDDRALECAAAVERGSTHVLGRALAAAFPGLEEPVRTVETHTGNGLSGFVSDAYVRVGRPSWVADALLEKTAELDERAAAYAERGLTPVAVAIDGRLRAVVAFGDPLRCTADALVAALEARGAQVFIVSGDHARVVLDVARELRIPAHRALGEASPEDKLRLVRRLQAGGLRVAMLGDGVNDAAALRAANVGIAVAGGTSAALAAADIFLLTEGMSPVPQLLEGADRVMQAVRRNLSLSLGYNFVGALAAVAGVVTPLLAAVAMPVSSLVVVGSSILQRSFNSRA